MRTSSRQKLVKSIENQSGRKVVIDTFETDDVLAKCRPQNLSPLFTLLPRELRDLIWAFATAPVEDQNEPFSKNAYYYRPGHTAKLKTDYNILLTCKQVWLEAHALPMLQAEHSFWYHRAAPDARSKAWMANLTALNRKHFGTLHLYAQMYAIENLTSGVDNLRNYFLPSALKDSEAFQPSKLHVTIRHTDWWHWEEDVPLRFEYKWFQAMLDSPDLRRTETLMLELETLDYKVPQLTPIVDRIQRLQSRELITHDVNGTPTPTKFVLTGNPALASWTGPTNLDGQNYTPYEGKKELKYHVVTLTWKLNFPQHPKAHIPTLRLAPQVPSLLPTHTASLPNPSTNYPALDLDGATELRNLLQEATLGRRSYPFRFTFPEFQERRRLAQIMQSTVSPTGGDRDDDRDDDMDHNMDDGWNDLLEMERHVQMRSSWEARVVEWSRRRQFWLCMHTLREDYWREKFAAEKSLLSLEDFRVP